jgi:hypothetical protein
MFNRAPAMISYPLQVEKDQTLAFSSAAKWSNCAVRKVALSAGEELTNQQAQRDSFTIPSVLLGYNAK